MLKVVWAILIAVAIAACNRVPIGPVEHDCPINPAKSSGSGCEVPP